MAAQPEDILPDLSAGGDGITHPHGADVFAVGAGGDLQPAGGVVIDGVEGGAKGAVHFLRHLLRCKGIVLFIGRPAVGIPYLDGGIHRNEIGVLGGAPNALGGGGNAAADGKIGAVGVLPVIIDRLPQHLLHARLYPVARFGSGKPQGGGSAQIVIIILDVAVAGHRHRLGGLPCGGVTHLILHHTAQNLIGIAGNGGAAVDDIEGAVAGQLGFGGRLRLRFGGRCRGGGGCRGRLRLGGRGRGRGRLRLLYRLLRLGVGLVFGFIVGFIVGFIIWLGIGFVGFIVGLGIGFVGLVFGLAVGFLLRLFRRLPGGPGGRLVLLGDLIFGDMLPVRQQGLPALHGGSSRDVVTGNGGAAAGGQQQQGGAGGQYAGRFGHRGASFRTVL